MKSRGGKKYHRHSKKKGGINWQFWKKPEDANAPAPVPAPAANAQVCPPCPVCQKPVAPAPAPMPAAAAEEMSMPMEEAPPQQHGGNKKRRRGRGKRHTRKGNKKSWFQIGCKTLKL